MCIFSVAHISFQDNWRKLLIKEIILIQNQKPLQNFDQSSLSLYLFNTLLNLYFFLLVT